MNKRTCRKCGEFKTLAPVNFRESSRYSHGQKVWFFRATCRACEALSTQENSLSQRSEREEAKPYRPTCPRCTERRDKREFRRKLYAGELHPWCRECRSEFEPKGIA